MKRYVYFIIGLIYKPGRVLKEILEEGRIGFAFFIVLTNGIISSGLILLNPPEAKFALAQYIPFLLPPLVILLWLLLAGLFQVASKRFKGEGTYKNMLIGLGSASFVFFIGKLITYIFLSPLKLTFHPVVCGYLNLLIMAWFITILLIAIKITQNLTILKAIGTIGILIFYLVVITIIIVIFLTWLA